MKNTSTLLLVTLLALFSTVLSGDTKNCGAEGAGRPVLDSCNDIPLCRHRCYYNYDQFVVKFDTSSDELQTTAGLPETSYTSQYATDVTGFHAVRNQYLMSLWNSKQSHHRHRWFSTLEEKNTNEENTEEGGDQDTNTQFFGFGWSWFPKVQFRGISDLTHKVDSRGKYVSIDVEIVNKRQIEAYDYTCVKGSHLKSNKTIQHTIDEYNSIIDSKGYVYHKEKLKSFMTEDINMLADFNKNCKNDKDKSFIERYKKFINEKYSAKNYERNYFLAVNYMFSWDYFNHLGKMLQLFSNFPVCRCSVFRYFTPVFGASKGWTVAERTVAVNDINKKCTDALTKNFGTRATLIREY